MFNFSANIMRLLIGASLVLTSLVIANETSDSTFLFCLKSSDKPLSIEREENYFSVDNVALNRALHDLEVLNIEPWITSATNRDSHKGVYLNRIYRVYIDSDRMSVVEVMANLDASYPFLYVEHEL